MSMRELLGVSPDVRKLVKDMVTTKKVPTEEATDTTKPVQVALMSKTKRASLPDPPAGMIVAKEVESLRTIEVNIAGKIKIDALVDDGSQIIGIHRDIWRKLGIPARSDHTLTMEAANSSKSSTAGLLPHLEVWIGSHVFYLQVQVVDDASYDMLLGRPFHALTRLNCQHHSDGGADIILRDPNTGAVIRCPTKERVDR
ncbi:hypothetical protein DFP72DRAFT_982676, partial [Ephemerocybe angulata]